MLFWHFFPHFLRYSPYNAVGGIAAVSQSEGVFFFFLQEITLTEKSKVFDSWKNPPPPVYMEYYFFNVTNPEEFLAGGKAAVKQIGPYTYR